MWNYWIFLLLGSVQTLTLDSANDKPVDLSLELSQNETNSAAEFNTSSTNTPIEFSKRIQDVQFPFMAAILHFNNLLLGTGAIVGERWILVTGFQLGAFKPDQLRVRVGSNSALDGGKVLNVDHLYSHPMYSEFNNDIALVKTTEDIVNNSTIQTIAIGSSSATLGTPANFLVWNKDYQVESSEADIVPVSECHVFFPDFELTESNMCMVLDHILPFSVTLYGSPVIVNKSLVGLYMGLEANTVKPYLCTSLAPLNHWIQHMMTNESETLNLFPIT